MTVTDEMKEAVRLITTTDNNVFITGKAGTGKTTFLRHLQGMLDRCVVAAPTGVAAINARGVTLHSLFAIPFTPQPPGFGIDLKMRKDRIELIRGIRTLIIDEISMVRADIMDHIDMKLRAIRENGLPFGGVKLVMFGDLFQLPPVVTKKDREILEKYYDNYYFFNAKAFGRCGFKVVELTRIFRQADPTFTGILNRIRSYQAEPEDLEALSERRDKEAGSMFDDGRVHLCTHRAETDRINAANLGEPTFSSMAAITGTFPESSAPCDLKLDLRVGARIMAIRNDRSSGYYNGMLGVVKAIGDNKVIARMDSGAMVEFEKYTWENLKYTMHKNELATESIGTCRQFPITLAWAVTIHKSQGLTFDKVALHVDRTFCAGQLYVALSRCRTLEGIVTDSFIRQRMVIPEYALTDFERTYKDNDNWFGKLPSRSGKMMEMYGMDSKGCDDNGDINDDMHDLIND